MSTAIEELYNEKPTDYGRLSTPDLHLFTAQQENKPPEISCVDILEHIQTCPVCSKLYTYNNPNIQGNGHVTENYRHSKDHDSKNNTFVFGIVGLIFVLIVVVFIIFMLVRNDRRHRKLFHSPSYRSK